MRFEVGRYERWFPQSDCGQLRDLCAFALNRSTLRRQTRLNREGGTRWRLPHGEAGR
jgi:hypothetical protein